MITASIVLFNTSEEVLRNVIDSYSPAPDRRLFLIDNSAVPCPAGEAYGEEEYIFYIHNDRNIGYGAAHNLGIKNAILEKSDYHLVLNPDISFAPKVIDELKDYADDHLDVVYMLPRVVYPDGSIQYLCKLLPTPSDLIFRRFLPEVPAVRKKNDRYTLKDTGYDRIMNPPCLSGCFMFMRTSALAENQLCFDERFFMYCEDFDLIRRLHRIGRTLFYPEVTIVHNHEKSSYKDTGMLMEHIKSACRYFNKYGWFTDHERDEMNRKILEEIC